MIRHTKFRCEININPVRTRNTNSNLLDQKTVICQPNNHELNNGFEQMTQVSIHPTSIQYKDFYPKVSSPRNIKTKDLSQDISTGYRTFTESTNQFFSSRQELFQSPEQHRRIRNYPSFCTSRDNRLMSLSRNQSKSILATECISEFSYSNNQIHEERGKSEQLQRLREQNFQLKRLLKLSDSWFSCQCKSPYVQQQTVYLRSMIHGHFDSTCRAKEVAQKNSF